MSDAPAQSPSTQFAAAFATHLIRGDFVAASSLLAPNLRAEYPPIVLGARFFRMFRGYTTALPARIYVDPDLGELQEWPGKQLHDLGSVYVSIEGEGFSEAVTCTVATFEGQTLIRELYWGRP